MAIRGAAALRSSIVPRIAAAVEPGGAAGVGVLTPRVGSVKMKAAIRTNVLKEVSMAWHRWVSVLPERQGLSPGREEAGKAAAPEGMEEPMGIGLGVPLVVGLMMAGGWLALEWFNYSASQYALTVFFGNLMADGLSWAVLLALGLWLVDLSGLLYLSLPSEREKPGFWYVLVAWLLASGANALLKWWAVTLALMASPLAQPGAGGTSRVASLFPRARHEWSSRMKHP
jgi:hypothetical protein